MLSKLKQNPESKVSKISVSFDFYNVTFKKDPTKLTVDTQIFLAWFFQLTKKTSLNENNSNRMLSKLKQNPESKVSKTSVSFDFYNVTFKKATTKLTVATEFFLEPK